MDKVQASLIIAEHFGELSAALWLVAGEPLAFRADKVLKLLEKYETPEPRPVA